MLDELWDGAPKPSRRFDASALGRLPEPAARYLTHAIARGTPLASAVRIRSHGQIRLKGWFPFEAEQVIRWDRGMVWHATARVCGATISGSDRLVDGEGQMRWNLFGVVPVVRAGGADISRSAAGRVNIESIWLPGVLCAEDVQWTQSSPLRATAVFTAHKEPAHLHLEIDSLGRVQSMRMPRWGNPAGEPFHYVDFGGWAESEREFGGYTIPDRMRIGWFFGSERFEAEGEFFRVTLDAAEYR
jgi:hypothetical protein